MDYKYTETVEEKLEARKTTDEETLRFKRKKKEVVLAKDNSKEKTKEKKLKPDYQKHVLPEL
jgi:hypothetical protein